MPRNDNSVRVPQREKVKNSFEISSQNWTPKQKQIIECILDKNTKVVFVDGVAGTSKTYLGTYCGLNLLAEKKVGEFIYIRTIIESASKSLGFLPGIQNEKMKPFLAPLEDKMFELLEKPVMEALLKENRVRAIPINFLRGCSFNATYIFADETQNFDFKELTTVLTRLGKFSKLIICGDSRQSDINGKSGFPKMFNLFNDEESVKNGIHCFRLGKEDIVRSEILKFIVEKLETVSALS